MTLEAMQRKLVLFDIDGTILLSGGAGRRALIRVMTETVGDLHAFGRVRFDGKTDLQIIVELLQEAGLEHHDDDPLVEALSDKYLDILEAELASPEAPLPALMPGVAELLDVLHEDARVTVGLLTGNLAKGANLKLRSVGIDPARFAVGAYGSDSSHRPNLPAIAAKRAEPYFGRVPTGDDIVIIGDTPADVTCGMAIGARAIAVATGNYGVTDLTAAGAYLVVEDLADTAPVIDAIFA